MRQERRTSQLAATPNCSLSQSIRRLSARRNFNDAPDHAKTCGSLAARAPFLAKRFPVWQWRAFPRGGKAASQQARLIADEHAFEREHLLFGLRAAGGRAPAELAAGREHAVARADPRHG